MSAQAMTEHMPPPTKSARSGGSSARHPADASKTSQKVPITAAVRKQAERIPMNKERWLHVAPSCCRVLTSSNGASRQPRIAPPKAPATNARASGVPSNTWCLLITLVAVLYPTNGTVLRTTDAAVAGTTPRYKTEREDVPLKSSRSAICRWLLMVSNGCETAAATRPYAMPPATDAANVGAISAVRGLRRCMIYC
eukprot:scaffold13084_cov112-Isochrysis_galbana.AAC.3